MSSYDLCILSGESSGDLQGAELIQALLNQNPDLKICAVAGPEMRLYPIDSIFPMEELQVMGFIDLLPSIFRLIKCFRRLRSAILQRQPKVVVTIDYPGFHLRLASSLRKAGFRGKIIHYVCPSVWAWGKKRIPKMAETLDLLLTLFPFEKKCFERTSLPVICVGHPLVKKISEYRGSSDFFSRTGLSKNKRILALFPGSRKKEIERNLPIQLAVAEELQRQDPDLQIAISLANTSTHIHSHHPLIEPQDSYDLMKHADLSIATSGTVTLELALFQTPTIVNYAIRPFDVFLAQKIFRISLPYYCIVNIIADARIFPELFGPHLTFDALLHEARLFWRDSNRKEQCRHQCARIKEILKDHDAAEEAALHILQSLSVGESSKK